MNKLGTEFHRNLQRAPGGGLVRGEHAATDALARLHYDHALTQLSESPSRGQSRCAGTENQDIAVLTHGLVQACDTAAAALINLVSSSGSMGLVR